MALPIPMADLWRGDFLESRHLGHAVLCDETGAVIRAWGDPDEVVLPRSSVKMIQALPLLASGAADAAGLGPEQLALACASHNGAAIHTERVNAWLSDLGLGDEDFRCGPQMPADREAREAMIRAGAAPCQVHNNCSGKHAGFLTLNRHLGGDGDYVAPDHPVQRAVLEAFETVTGETSPGYGIDGCSAPNFAASLTGIARAMAWFAGAAGREDGLSRGAARLVDAMTAHPALVAGEGRACTELMRAMGGRAAIKTGAEGVFVAIIPELRQGLALKIADGATRASELAVSAILVELGLLDPAHPAVTERLEAPILNRRDIETGHIRRAPDFP
ncbi:asparaginase [Aquicoccus sp. SCR17]|nr:asparaginase [Carideicomes alvinocaridis]